MMIEIYDPVAYGVSELHRIAEASVDDPMITVGPVPKRFCLTGAERAALRDELRVYSSRNRIARGESQTFSYL